MLTPAIAEGQQIPLVHEVHGALAVAAVQLLEEDLHRVGRTHGYRLGDRSRQRRSHGALG